MNYLPLICICTTLSICANNISSLITNARDYTSKKQFDAAISAYQKAVAQAPGNMGIIWELASCMAQTERTQETLKLYHQLRAHFPNSVAILYNTAYVLKKMGNMREAQLLYRKVLNREPHNAQAHVGIAQAHLSLGNFTEGWEELDWQFHPRIMSAHALRASIDHSHDLTGKTVIIREDWSCGDTFQFLRFVKELKERYHPTIIFIGRDRNKFLSTILKEQPYIDQYLPPNSALPPHDFITSSIGLPMVLRTTVTTIPSEPYIHLDEQHIERWRSFLPHDSFNIGICWQGDPCHAAEKYMPLNIMAQLNNLPSIRLFSLQRFHGLEQLTQLAQPERIHQFDETFDKTHGAFIDTAALMHHLDLVITIDTSIAHLAGAMGKKVWLILPELPDYRWHLAADSSPWYPSMRIFKKQKNQTWHQVMLQIARELVCEQSAS